MPDRTPPSRLTVQDGIAGGLEISGADIEGQNVRQSMGGMDEALPSDRKVTAQVPA